VTGENPTVLTSQLPRVREYLDRAIAEAVNEAAKSLRDIREWCDRSEAAARAEPLCHTGCSCRFDTRMQLIDEVRGLLPSLPVSAGEVTS